MSDVEYIIQVQQNYVITQENALEAIKSFEGEAESLTLIKVSLSFLFCVQWWSVTTHWPAGSYATMVQDLLALSFLESFKLASWSV